MTVDRREALQTMAGAFLGVLQRPGTFLDPGRCASTPQAGFDDFCFSDSLGRRHQVYVANGGGPPVLLLHELPGLVDQDLTTARQLAGHGYTVVAPLLFGEAGGSGHSVKYATKLCGRDEFACSEGHITSPHVIWLRELLHDVWARWPIGRGIGVIGMCLTGAFPLALLSDKRVIAAVLCQPTLPLSGFSWLGLSRGTKDLGLHPDDLEKAKSRSEVPILGLRYTGDRLSRAKRFEGLTEQFGGRFYRMDLKGAEHSTIGLAYCGLAFEEVTALLNQHLRVIPDASVHAFPIRSCPDSLKEVLVDGCGNAADRD